MSHLILIKTVPLREKKKERKVRKLLRQNRHTQEKWAYHKYWVMGHSQAHYNALRQLFKGNDWSLEKEAQFDQLLAEAATIAPTKATLTTSYQHMWGYFKKVATPQERETYKELIEQVCPEQDALGAFLLTLIDRYHIPYLLHSKFYEDRGF